MWWSGRRPSAASSMTSRSAAAVRPASAGRASQLSTSKLCSALSGIVLDAMSYASPRCSRSTSQVRRSIASRMQPAAGSAGTIAAIATPDAALATSTGPCKIGAGEGGSVGGGPSGSPSSTPSRGRESTRRAPPVTHHRRARSRRSCGPTSRKPNSGHAARPAPWAPNRSRTASTSSPARSGRSSSTPRIRRSTASRPTGG